MRLLAAVLLVWALPAAAEPPAPVVRTESDVAPRNYLNLRAGFSSTNRSGHPDLCFEASPIAPLAVEACGTGSGFLHHDPAPELAHFRAKWRVAEWQSRVGWLQLHVGGGFSELQVGEDGAGFSFRGVDATGTSTAGPEAGAGLRLLVPLGAGFEAVGELGAAAAYLNYAPKLAVPMRAWQPSAGFTLGVGF